MLLSPWQIDITQQEVFTLFFWTGLVLKFLRKISGMINVIKLRGKICSPTPLVWSLIASGEDICLFCPPNFCYCFCSFLTGQFLIQKVVPQASGESSKVKVKVRVNIHGIFSVSSASLVEVQKCDETEEPMETEQANDKDGEVRQCNKYIFSTQSVLAFYTLCISVLGQKA